MIGDYAFSHSKIKHFSVPIYKKYSPISCEKIPGNMVIFQLSLFQPHQILNRENSTQILKSEKLVIKHHPLSSLLN